MAATTRATSTEPFPALATGPRTPTSLARIDSTTAGKEVSLSPKTNRLALSPVPLTGQAAMSEIKKRKQQQKAAGDSRETSPNPAVQAIKTLMGSGGMGKPGDAPAPDKVSEPLQLVAERMDVSASAQNDSMHPSPVTMSSLGTNENSGASRALTATAADIPASIQQLVAEPAQMTEPATYHSNGNLDVAADQDGPKAFSYPGPPPQEQNQEGGPSRGMSLPGYGQGSPKSPASNKRHKCPYCSTDFTRHHNLKSHLLTHSQEKPYVCQTCQARFRRLHDLKRHTKLHTGERPHTCDKCGRRFARGDALARHNKGPGGCAGRRSSFGGDDEFGPDGEAMDGVEYGEDDEGSSPDNGRRVSEPSRKRAHVETPQDPNRSVYRQFSSTYPPPLQSRPHSGSVGSMGPPQVVLPGSNTVHSPREMSTQQLSGGGSSINSSHYSGSGQVFTQQAGMIESPKPLSPGQPAGQDQHRLSVGDASMSNARNRSPSLTTQFQQTHFGRGSGHRTPPHPTSQFASTHPGGAQIPVLPPLTSQPQGRSGLQATSLPGGPGPSMLHHQQLPPASANSGGPGSNPGSLSSHGRSSGSSMRDAMGMDANDIWGYVRSLESRFSRMQDEYELRISRLQEEVISLKGQMSNAASYSSDMGQNTRY